MMTNNNGIPPNTTQIQAMLIDAAPEGLKMLAGWGQDPTELHYISLDELDEFADGTNSQKKTEEALADGIYLQGVLPAVDWWIDVADALLLGRSKEGEWGGPEFDEQRAKLIALLNDVLSGYAAALAESPYYSRSLSTPAGVELMKRYRIYTRYVYAFAREMWPYIDLTWLAKHP